MKSLKTLISTIDGQNKFRLKVSVIDADSAIKKLKSDLNAILKTIKVDTGFSVTVTESGAVSATKEIAGDAKGAALSLAEVNARLKEIGLTNQSIATSYKKVKDALGGEGATGENLRSVDELKQKYNELLTVTNNLQANKTQVTQKEVEQIYAVQAAMQILIASVRERIDAENEAAAAAERAAESAERAANRQASANKKQFATIRQVQQLYGQVEKYLAKNPRVAKTNEGEQLLELQERLSAVTKVTHNFQSGLTELSKTKFAGLQDQFSVLTKSLRDTGKEGKSLGNIILSAYEKFGGWMLITKSLTSALHVFRDMVEVVKSIDAAMTELRKVTNETEVAYTRFLENVVIPLNQPT